MTQIKPIEIPLSKVKMTLTFIGAIVFVVLGFGLIFYPLILDFEIIGSCTVTTIVGLSSILFFGLIAVVVIRKMSDKKAGLIINAQGIVDNSSGVSAGTILWSDILEIKVSNVVNQKFIMIIVKNPQVYIYRVTNKLKRKGMEMNYKSYGSPISISANSLKISFNSLHALLTTKMKDYKS
jgi:hypothetical protein